MTSKPKADADKTEESSGFLAEKKYGDEQAKRDKSIGAVNHIQLRFQKGIMYLRFGPVLWPGLIHRVWVNSFCPVRPYRRKGERAYNAGIKRNLLEMT